MCDCGKVFLDMDAYEYVKHHKRADPQKRANLQAIVSGVHDISAFKSEDIQKYDNWYLAAINHWIENPTHNITVTGPRAVVNVSAEFKESYNLLGNLFLGAMRKVCEIARDANSVI